MHAAHSGQEFIAFGAVALQGNCTAGKWHCSAHSLTAWAHHARKLNGAQAGGFVAFASARPRVAGGAHNNTAPAGIILLFVGDASLQGGQAIRLAYCPLKCMTRG